MKLKSSEETPTVDSPACLFSDELDELVDRYLAVLPIGSVVGTLHVKAHYLCHEAACRDMVEQGER